MSTSLTRIFPVISTLRSPHLRMPKAGLGILKLEPMLMCKIGGDEYENTSVCRLDFWPLYPERKFPSLDIAPKRHHS
jgi:hypothetical protein